MIKSFLCRMVPEAVCVRLFEYNGKAGKVSLAFVQEHVDG